jgi:hypothetical protein
MTANLFRNDSDTAILAGILQGIVRSLPPKVDATMGLCRRSRMHMKFDDYRASGHNEESGAFTYTDMYLGHRKLLVFRVLHPGMMSEDAKAL